MKYATGRIIIQFWNDIWHSWWHLFQPHPYDGQSYHKLLPLRKFTHETETINLAYDVWAVEPQVVEVWHAYPRAE